MIHYCDVDLDHLADIASLSPLESYLPPLFTLYFGSVFAACIRGMVVVVVVVFRLLGGRVFTEIIWKSVQVCLFPPYVISISTDSFILPLGCNPVLCYLLLLKLLSAVATGGSSPLAPMPLHLPHQ